MPPSRSVMIHRQLVGRGITDTAVLDAFAAVPREHFVPVRYREHAYADRPLPLPAGQTISQPFVVALMLTALRLQPDDKVLEVGTGSGYAAALLSHIVRVVYTIERHPELVTYARDRLADLGCDNVHVLAGDGTLGCPDHAPFNAIVVAAGGPRIPASLRTQLAVGGRLVMPIGGQPRSQNLVRLTRHETNRYGQEALGAVAFVPLVGVEGWSDVSSAADDDEFSEKPAA